MATAPKESFTGKLLSFCILFCLPFAVGCLAAESSPAPAVGNPAAGRIGTQEEAYAFLTDRLLDRNTKGRSIYAAADKVGTATVTLALQRSELALSGGPGWLFFIDDHPQANWDHPCRYVLVGEDTRLTVADATTPPRNRMTFSPLTRPAEPTAEAIPSFLPGASPSADSPSPDSVPAKNRYAMILSGGGTDVWSNWQRYWNQCSLFHKTLKQNGFLDENIYVLISDGTDPGKDTVWVSGYDNDKGRYIYEIISSPLDLDGDGRPDTRYRAGRAEFFSVFDELAARLDRRDLLYMYVTDHGSPTADNKAPYLTPDVELVLWGGETLRADEFAAALNKVKARAVVGMFQQCYGGGFVEKLAGPNRVLLSACRWWEFSFARYMGYAFLFDEWSYHALGALADPALADSNGDGRTTMEETYLYALTKDQFQAEDGAQEHPAYYSNPWDLGRQISLQGIRRSDPPPVYADFVQMELSKPYPAPGRAMGWHADDATWTYPLPFSFPFGGVRYRTVDVSSNGIVFFASPNAGGENTVNGLAAATAVAPLWDDLTTEGPDTDIYIDDRHRQITISWSARAKTANQPVNMAVQLFPDGRILFYYGEGNNHIGFLRGSDKTIGISTGGNPHFSLRNGAGRLDRARPVAYLPLDLYPFFRMPGWDPDLLLENANRDR